MPLPAIAMALMRNPQMMKGLMGGLGLVGGAGGGRRRRRRRTLTSGEMRDITFLKSNAGPAAVQAYLASRR